MENNSVNKSGFYKLKWFNRISYGAGDMAQNLIYQTVSIWLLFFYTNIFGLDPAAAGTMFLIVRIVDVIWDPIVGAFVDKHHPKMGKYRAYLIIGGIPLTGFAILCFWNGFTGSLAYAYFTYVALSMCYTLVNVPYGALNSSLTRDTDEITILTSTRMFMANLGGLAVSSGIPLLIALYGPKDENGVAILNTPEAAGAWFITMTIYALVGLALLFLCFFNTKERVVMKKSLGSSVKVSDLWMEFVRNRPLRILAFFFITAFAMMSISNATGSYFMTYNMSATPEEMSIYMALIPIPSFIILPFVPYIKKKIGKKQMFYLFLTIAIIGTALLYVISIMPNSHDNMILIFVIQFFRYGGVYVATCYMWALVPEVVAFGEYKTGRRISGIVKALTGIFFKAGMALGGAVPGFVLAFVGFDAGAATQTEFTEQGILWLVCIIPIILMIIAIFIISKYELTDKKMDEINMKIEARAKKE